VQESIILARLNGSKVLYAHLSGAPALNGYSYTFRNG
jgi:1-aminocyclopropane-1-carboxylate deaminase